MTLHLGLGLLFAFALAASPATSATADLAKVLGAREAVRGLQLSPDGSRVSYITPLGTSGAALMVADIATGQSKQIFSNDSSLLRLDWCGWAKADRLICQIYGITDLGDVNVSFTRLVAMDSDGSSPKVIGQKANSRSLGINQYSGGIINWLPDSPDELLMELPELGSVEIGTRLAKDSRGLAASRVNIRTGTKRRAESARREAAQLFADASGEVRLMAVINATPTGRIGKSVRYFYRTKNGSEWLGLADSSLTGSYQTWIEGFDETGDWVYVLTPKDGRQALYRYAVDGTARKELVYAHSHVDVSGVLRIGKYRRPVAAEYIVDGTHFEFFDPALAKLSATLSKALPHNPPVTILDESWDGTKKLVYLGTDVDPGRYYLYETKSKQLVELLPARVGLEAFTAASMKPLTYSARDGVQIPGYLTLPPSGAAKNLPAIVMPHGGPSARDKWGFDWLAQYFAQQGYAVLQPNYRGSSGYGEAWYVNNGVKSWQTAIGDINDGARWLVAQGIADPNRVAIFGWSYGGYAALQANVVEPELYKAAIAVAPVTDWELVKTDAYRFTSYLLVADFIGSGPHVKAGSPALNADRIKTPVLLFHGDQDLNVGINHSRRMKAALDAAGNSTELIVYPNLDHGLEDSEARADLLRRSAEFLGRRLGR